MNDETIEFPEAPPAPRLGATIRPLPHQTRPACLVSPFRETDEQTLAETLQLRGWSVKRWGVNLIVHARADAIAQIMRDAGYVVRVGEGLIVRGPGTGLAA